MHQTLIQRGFRLWLFGAFATNNVCPVDRQVPPGALPYAVRQGRRASYEGHRGSCHPVFWRWGSAGTT